MYKIKLELEKKTYDLQALYYSCYNSPPATDGEEYLNPPSQSMTWNVKAFKIDQELLEWCTEPRPSLKSGKVTVYDAETNAPVKIVSFQGAYCSGFSESIEANNDYNTNSPVSVTVTAEKIAVKLVASGNRVHSPN
jgi:Hemolysin coregulated protein Hcp (TssD)